MANDLHPVSETKLIVDSANTDYAKIMQLAAAGQLTVADVI